MYTIIELNNSTEFNVPSAPAHARLLICDVIYRMEETFFPDIWNIWQKKDKMAKTKGQRCFDKKNCYSAVLLSKRQF